MHCDVKVPKAEHAACVAKGLNEGIARLHVYDAKTRRRYLLNDQKRATPYAGRFVTVAGDMQEAVGRHPQDLDGVIAIDDVTAHLAAHLGLRVVKPVSRVDHWCWGNPNLPGQWYKNVTTVFHQGGTQVGDVVARAIGAAIAQA